MNTTNIFGSIMGNIKGKGCDLMGVFITENRFKLARTKYNRHGPESVKVVAKSAGVTGSLIDDLESNVGKPRDVGYTKIKKLAKHYGVSSDFLLGLSEIPSVKSENPLAQECIHRSTPTINPTKDETSVDYSIKSDKGKYRPTLCHRITIEAVSRVREHGASRYGGTETWKRVEEQRYKDALYRHWLAYLENPDGVDADSGLPILWHVACNADFLLELQRERMSENKLQRVKGSG